MSSDSDQRKRAQRPPSAPSYDVGFGKPPVRSRFEPGQSGNPRGRPKGSRNRPPSPSRPKGYALSSAKRRIEWFRSTMLTGRRPSRLRRPSSDRSPSTPRREASGRSASSPSFSVQRSARTGASAKPNLGWPWITRSRGSESSSGAGSSALPALSPCRIRITLKSTFKPVRSTSEGRRQSRRRPPGLGGMSAAHKAGRRAYLCEIDPIYCDRILARWEAFANDEAQLLHRVGDARTRAGGRDELG